MRPFLCLTSISMKARRIFAMIVLALIWGSSWIAQNAMQGAVPPLRCAALQSLLAAVLLVPLIQWKRWKWPAGKPLQACFILSSYYALRAGYLAPLVCGWSDAGPPIKPW